MYRLDSAHGIHRGEAEEASVRTEFPRTILEATCVLQCSPWPGHHALGRSGRRRLVFWPEWKGFTSGWKGVNKGGTWDGDPSFS